MIRTILCSLLIASSARFLSAREWSDASGKYTLEADLVARDDVRVVLQRGDHHLVEVPINDLSKRDAEYLASKEGSAAADSVSEALQTWTTQRGLKFEGRIVDYFDRDVTIQFRRGKLYVQDRKFDNLPEIYQLIVTRVVEHFEGIDLPQRTDLNRWVAKQKLKPRTFSCQGVVVELANGDEYAVPFFVLSDKDAALLKPGWDEWKKSLADEEAHSQAAFRVQALAAARSRDQQVDRQIAKLQLLSNAVMIGATALWEVTLYPGPGTAGQPIWAVVPGQNSAQAMQNAMANNPGYIAGPVRRATR